MKPDLSVTEHCFIFHDHDTIEKKLNNAGEQFWIFLYNEVSHSFNMGNHNML